MYEVAQEMALGDGLPRASSAKAALEESIGGGPPYGMVRRQMDVNEAREARLVRMEAARREDERRQQQEAREKEWRQSRYRQLAQQQEWSSLHDLHVPDPPAWSRPDHPSHLGSGSRSGTGVERSVRSEVTSPVHKWRDWPTTGTDTDTAVPPGVRGAGPGSAACSSTKRGGGSPTSTKLTSPQLNPPSGSFCCCHGTPSHGTQPSHLTPSAKGHGSSSSSGGGCGGGLVPPTHRQAPPSTTSSNPIGASAAARGMAYRKGGRVAWQGEEQRVQHVLNLARQAEAGKLLTKGQTQQMINMARDFRAT